MRVHLGRVTESLALDAADTVTWLPFLAQNGERKGMGG